MIENIYETIIIITPVISDNQIIDISNEFISYLKENNAKIRNQEYWGLKKLAYPIQKKQSGWYCLFEYSSIPSLIVDLDLKLRRDDRIIRFLTVKFNKYALAYSERRIKKIENKQENII